MTLENVKTGPLNDGCWDPFCVVTDRFVEAYGTITVDRVRVKWNNYPCGAGLGGGDCLGPGPTTSDIRQNRQINWSSQWLGISGANAPTNPRLRKPNTTFRYTRFFLVGERPSVTISWRFKDRDIHSAHETWCESSGQTTFTLSGRLEFFDPPTRERLRCSIVVTLSNRYLGTRF